MHNVSHCITPLCEVYANNAYSVCLRRVFEHEMNEAMQYPLPSNITTTPSKQKDRFWRPGWYLYYTTGPISSANHQQHDMRLTFPKLERWNRSLAENAAEWETYQRRVDRHNRGYVERTHTADVSNLGAHPMQEKYKDTIRPPAKGPFPPTTGHLIPLPPKLEDLPFYQTSKDLFRPSLEVYRTGRELWAEGKMQSLGWEGWAVAKSIDPIAGAKEAAKFIKKAFSGDDKDGDGDDDDMSGL